MSLKSPIYMLSVVAPENGFDNIRFFKDGYYGRETAVNRVLDGSTYSD
jgi:hypothetical protein